MLHLYATRYWWCKLLFDIGTLYHSLLTVSSILVVPSVECGMRNLLNMWSIPYIQYVVFYYTGRIHQRTGSINQSGMIEWGLKFQITEGGLQLKRIAKIWLKTPKPDQNLFFFIGIWKIPCTWARGYSTHILCVRGQILISFEDVQNFRIFKSSDPGCLQLKLWMCIQLWGDYGGRHLKIYIDQSRNQNFDEQKENEE